jgi:ribosomal protein S18 acetylase RimI-like enzyme
VNEIPLRQDLSLWELFEATDKNLVVHMGYLPRQTEGMEVWESDGLCHVDSGLPCDTYNGVCNTRLRDEDALQVAKQVITHFQRLERPFAWWVSPSDTPSNLGTLLVELGLKNAGSNRGMVLDRENFSPCSTGSPDFAILRVESQKQLLDFAEVVSENWEPADVEVVRFYERTGGALFSADSPLHLFVGYEKGVAVCTAQITLGGGIAGMYNVCTREAYRRRGYGLAMSVRCVEQAFECGCRYVTLQASEAGGRVYERIGFREMGLYTEYKP